MVSGNLFGRPRLSTSATVTSALNTVLPLSITFCPISTRAPAMNTGNGGPGTFEVVMSTPFNIAPRIDTAAAGPRPAEPDTRSPRAAEPDTAGPRPAEPEAEHRDEDPEGAQRGGPGVKAGDGDGRGAQPETAEGLVEHREEAEEEGGGHDEVEVAHHEGRVVEEAVGADEREGDARQPAEDEEHHRGEPRRSDRVAPGPTDQRSAAPAHSALPGRCCRATLVSC